MEEYGTIWNDETTKIKSKMVSPEPLAEREQGTVGEHFFTVFTASCWC